jgi:hypothetical protein
VPGRVTQNRLWRWRDGLLVIHADHPPI